MCNVAGVEITATGCGEQRAPSQNLHYDTSARSINNEADHLLTFDFTLWKDLADQ